MTLYVRTDGERFWVARLFLGLFWLRYVPDYPTAAAAEKAAYSVIDRQNKVTSAARTLKRIEG